MAYLKPQSPIKDKDGDYIYPLTTADQVIMSDGRRLNRTQFVSVEKDDAIEGETNPVNADTLSGKPESELSVAKAVDSDTLGNVPAEDYAQKEFVNNEITDRVIYGKGKNLLKNTANSMTANGVTFTVHEDGSVTANGTATSDTYFTINEINLPIGSFILSGCPTDGAGETYHILISGSDLWDADFGDSLTIENTTVNTVLVRIRLKKGYTANNLTFYPMIRLATETDDTYEPYYEGLMESVSKSQVVNNFTTTEEGFVADARALKALNDKLSGYLDFDNTMANLGKGHNWNDVAPGMYYFNTWTGSGGTGYPSKQQSIGIMLVLSYPGGSPLFQFCIAPDWISSRCYSSDGWTDWKYGTLTS